MEKIQYNENSKTLNIETNPKFLSEILDDMTNVFHELKLAYGNSIDKKVSFINVNRNMEILQISINDWHVNSTSEPAIENQNQSLSYFSGDKNILYVVNGKKVDRETFKNLSANQIESVNVIKSPSEIKALGYNPKTYFGVIQIQMKE